jgi:serine phosphatase RsbU (regulator of sigma subunit)
LGNADGVRGKAGEKVPEARQAYHDALGRLRATVRRPADDIRRTQIARAVGLLAGRVGCRLEEAQANLARMADEQNRDLGEVAAGVIDLLEPNGQDESATVDAVDAALRAARKPVRVTQIRVVDSAFGGSAPIDDVVAELHSQVAELSVAAVVLFGVEAEGSVRVVSRAGLTATDAAGWQQLAGAPDAVTAVRTGRPVWTSWDGEPGTSRPDEPWPSRAWLPMREHERVIGLIGVLWQAPQDLDAAARRALTRITAATRRKLRQLLPAALGADDVAEPSVTFQQVLDALPGSVALLSPVREGDDADVIDFEVEAASPEAVDSIGRRGAEMVGLRLRRDYTSPDPRVLDAYQRAVESGESQHIGSINRTIIVGDRQEEARFSVRAQPLGEHLLIVWNRHDQDPRYVERIAQTERLANLGWAEWDLTTGAIEWSDQIYRIYDRDPALGPMAPGEGDDMNDPADNEIRAAVADAFERGEQVDVVTRLRINDKLKYVRTVADAVRDSAGNPLKIYGVIQDVTNREMTRARLAEVERQLAEQQRTLAAEHRLASQLQRIVLPVPDAPIDLPGLRVALRYYPAEHLSRVGGDWYHAGTLPNGSILLAIGDVAGHGIRAATTMAQMRHSLRALTVTTTDPAELMANLNQLMCELGADATATTATAVIARYDPAERQLTWAQAGHPAPLFARGGRTAALARPAGPLLGVMPSASFESATVTFDPGGVLLLYTDGLVEHRTLTLEHGIATLISEVDNAIASDPDQPLAALMARLRRANPDDDTCILAARPIPHAHHSGGAPRSTPSNTPEDRNGRD